MLFKLKGKPDFSDVFSIKKKKKPFYFTERVKYLICPKASRACLGIPSSLSLMNCLTLP